MRSLENERVSKRNSILVRKCMRRSESEGDIDGGGGSLRRHVNAHKANSMTILFTNPMSSRRSEPAGKMSDKSVTYEQSEEEDLEMFEQDLQEDAQWKRIQQNTFTRWANEKLKVINKNIDDLEIDLSDGLRLISLIEVLAQKQLPKHNKKPIFRSITKVGKCVSGFKVFGRRGNKNR